MTSLPARLRRRAQSEYASGSLTARLRANARRQIVRGTLKARSAIQGEYVADYGWIRLPYTGDGDLQEVYYHANQAAWHDKDSAIFRSLVIPGTTVVDVGANLGFVTTMLSACAGPRGRVLAFEPSKATFGKLRRVVEINELRNVS